MTGRERGVERRREEGLGTYEARTVLGILNVKPHVLRYWERTLPLIRSRRDESGRRVWTAAQVRMLLRVRHHVVQRRLSPAAAGEALLLEAAGVRADAKARLEVLRGRLVALLLQARRASAALVAEDAAGAGRSTVRVAREARGRDGSAASEGSPPGTLSIAPLIDDGLIDPPAPDTVRSARGRSVVRARSFTAITRPTPSALRDAEGASFLPVVVGHLSAAGSPKALAAALRRLIEHRRAGVPDAPPSAIPVPSGAVEAYSEAFRDSLDSGAAFLVPLPHLEWRGRLWWSARLAVLAALAEDTELAHRLDRTGARTIYVWGADDPNAPVAPPEEMVRAARRSPAGLAMGLRRRGGALSAIDMSVIDAPRRQDVWRAAARCGAWSYHDPARTARRSPSLESHERASDNKGWMWRYDLWLRDMVRIEPALFLVDRPTAPSPWRGDRWLGELPYVWPAPFRGE